MSISRRKLSPLFVILLTCSLIFSNAIKNLGGVSNLENVPPISDTLPTYFLSGWQDWRLLQGIYGGGKENIRKSLEDYLLPLGIRSFSVRLDEIQVNIPGMHDFLDLADEYGLYVWIDLCAWGYVWAWGKDITKAYPETASIDQNGNVCLDLSPVIDFYDVLYPYFRNTLKTAMDLYGMHPSLMGVGTNPITDYPFYSGRNKTPYTYDGRAYGYNPISMQRFVQTEYFWRDVYSNGTHVKDGTVCKIWEMFVAKTANYPSRDIYAEWSNHHGTDIGAAEPLHGLNAYYNVENAKLLKALYDYVVSYTGKTWLLKHPWILGLVQVPSESGLYIVPSYTFIASCIEGVGYGVERFMQNKGILWFNLAHKGDTPFRLPTEDELREFYLLGLPVLAHSQFHEVDWRAPEITQEGLHTQYARAFGSILNRMRFVGGWFGHEKQAVKALFIGASGWAPQFFTPVANMEHALWEDYNLTRFGDFSKFNVIMFGGDSPNVGQVTSGAIERIKAFVSAGGGIVFVSSGGTASWVTEMLTGATVIMDSGGVYIPEHPILKPYGGAVYPTYKGTIRESSYGSGRAVWIDLGYPGFPYIGGGSVTKWHGSPVDSVIVLISNAILYAGKQDALIPAWWHTTYGVQPWNPLTYYSITGKPNTPKLLWLTNMGTSPSSFEIYLNASFFNINPQGWIAIDVQNWQGIAKGNGTDIYINTTIPAKSWKPIYIMNSTTNLQPLYSNIFIKESSIEGNRTIYTLKGSYNQTSWLILNSTKTPTSVTANNTGTLPQHTTITTLNQTTTPNGWHHDPTNKVLYIKFKSTSTVQIEIAQPTGPTHTLNIQSSPITGVSFTLDGVSRVTPFLTTLDEGSHIVTMPKSTVIGGTSYSFKNWEDGSTNPTRVINLVRDTSVTAYYEKVITPPVTHVLSVSSSPITGVSFTVDGTKRVTPWGGTLAEGTHTVVMPSSFTVGGVTYNFKSWEDASTSRTRTINLLADITITAYYEVAPSPPSSPPHPSPYPPANDALNLANPSIGIRGCLAAKQAYIFQVNVSDPDEIANLNYVDLILDPAGHAIKVRWTEGTDAWSEENDPSDYLYLGECWKSISNDRVTLNFAIVFRWTYPDENLHSVRLYSLNDNDLSDTDDFTDVYYVENDLAIQTPLVSDDRVDPGQTITLSGYIYYEGTSIPPPDGDYQVKAKLSGIQKGPTDTTLTSGHYTITIPAEPTVGSYTYQVFCRHNASAVDTPPVIVDKLMVSITADAHEVDVGTRVDFTLTITRQHDSTYVTSFAITTTRNGTTWLTLTDPTFNDALPTPGHYMYSTESIKDNTYGLTTFETNSLTISWRQKIVNIAIINIAIQAKDQAANTPISGASVYIKNETWTCETKYTNASGWANLTVVEVGTYTIVGEAKGYATALDTVSVTTDITYTLLVSKRASQLAATPIMSPDFALILMAASAFSAFSALSHFVFQRISKR